LDLEIAFTSAPIRNGFVAGQQTGIPAYMVQMVMVFVLQVPRLTVARLRKVTDGFVPEQKPSVVPAPTDRHLMAVVPVQHQNI